ncbi:hypothetical protein AJ80_09315 [Polytolypa hystricis UAMH7299]|uniref:Uncharacterized protein n=1 Tax=Polytolypa hystricis (strain UAMH7299) TaxID=1447883 RepID=A0A2B7WT92_POLH7|nr:hypothetical protein AJ80_09315 [Polytolypa hystricis UAMH7299]
MRHSMPTQRVLRKFKSADTPESAHAAQYHLPCPTTTTPSIQINHDSMQSTPRDPSQDRFSRTLDGERTGAPAIDTSSQWADPAPWEGSMNYTCPFPAPAEPIYPAQSLSGRSSGDATPAPGAALVDNASDSVDWSSWIEHNFLHPGDTPPDANFENNAEGVGWSSHTSHAALPTSDHTVPVGPCDKARVANAYFDPKAGDWERDWIRPQPLRGLILP